LPILGKCPLDQYIGDRRQTSGARPLHRPADDDERHVGRRGRDHQPAGEHEEARHVRPGRTVSIRELAGDDEGDEVGERVAGQGDAVQRVAVEFVGDRRQGRQHRRDLERDHHHAENEPDGEETLLTVESSAGRANRRHRGEPGATNGHGRARSTDNARSSSNCSLK
jgi:hypothetical protein